MIDETLGICIEIFDKKSTGQPIFPIESVKNFEFLLSTARDRPMSSISPGELPAIKKAEQRAQKEQHKPFKATSAPVRRESKNGTDSKSVGLEDPGTKKFLAARSLPVGEQLKLSLIEVTPNPKQNILWLSNHGDDNTNRNTPSPAPGFTKNPFNTHITTSSPLKAQTFCPQIKTLSNKLLYPRLFNQKATLSPLQKYMIPHYIKKTKADKASRRGSLTTYDSLKYDSLKFIKKVDLIYPNLYSIP